MLPHLVTPEVRLAGEEVVVARPLVHVVLRPASWVTADG